MYFQITTKNYIIGEIINFKKRYCDTWGCNGRCDGADTVLYDIENVLTGTQKGHIEDACYLAKRAIINEPCGGSNRKSMIVVLTNR